MHLLTEAEDPQKILALRSIQTNQATRMTKESNTFLRGLPILFRAAVHHRAKFVFLVGATPCQPKRRNTL
jgi:hypothetical protein